MAKKATPRENPGNAPQKGDRSTGGAPVDPYAGQQYGNLSAQAAPAVQSKQPVKAPSPEDFTGGAVTKAVLKESLQHPATIYPLAGSALALSWSLMIAASPASLSLMMGLAFVSATSFVYNYVVKGPDKARDYINRLRDLRRMSEVSSLDKLAVSCRSAGFDEGAKEALELKSAYEQLSRYLDECHQMASVDRFASLAEESLKQGIHTLEQALAVFRARESLDVESLERELAGWKSRMAQLDPRSGEAQTLKVKIDSHTKRILLSQQSEEKLAKLIAESNEIETALQTTYLELVDLGDQGIDDFLRQDGDAVDRLNQAVAAARRVEQRLRGDDSEREALKEKYLHLNEENQASQENQ